MRRHVEEVVNAQNLDVVDIIYDPDLIFNDPFAPGGAAHGHAGLKEFLTAIYTAMPDFQFVLEDLIVDGEKGVWRGVVSGTLRGQFGGIPPTGKHFRAPITEIFQLRADKIVEVWAFTDPLSILQQVGAIPTA